MFSRKLNWVKVPGYKGIGKNKVKDWLIALNQMKASDELDPTQVRQLLFDLERYYLVIVL